jgi:hypothetical protein
MQLAVSHRYHMIVYTALTCSISLGATAPEETPKYGGHYVLRLPHQG